MTRHTPKKNARKLPRLFFRWHRRIGVSAALFLMWIVISGWLLNHSDSLNLARKEIHSPALANWYKIHYQVPTQGFVHNNHLLISNDDTLLLDGKKINTTFTGSLGVAADKNLIAIASANEVLLLDEQYQVIDKLDKSSLPLPTITKIGTGCNGILISDNLQHYSSNDGVDWQPCSELISWSQQETLNTQQMAQAESQLVPAISLEKVIVDLHTGRFFGTYGAYVVDAIGLCLLLLALSGLWLFFKLGHKSNRH